MLEIVRSFLRLKVGQPTWQSFLLERLEKTATLIREGFWIPCLDMPGLIFSGLNKSRFESLPVTTISTIIYLGADLLDDLHDSDLNSTSYTISTAEVTLISTTLLTAFPTLVLAELNATAETKFALQTTIAKSLLKMSEGQRRDICNANKGHVSLKDIRESIKAKSGEELALSCLLASQLANVILPQQKLYEKFGSSLGTALQIVSDFHDIMWSPISSDIRQGTRTLPIAFCIEKLDGDMKQKFMSALQVASKDPEQLNLLRKILADSGSLDYLALVVEDLCQQALETLELLELSEEVKTHLKNRIQSASLLQTGPEGLNPSLKRRFYESTITAG